MDFIAHGLWTNAVYEGAARRNGKERSKKEIAWSVFFGIAPDFFSFGVLLFVNLLGQGVLWPYAQARFQEEWGPVTGNIFQAWVGAVPPPDPSQIPMYIHHLYNLTHSFVIFAAVFLAVWFLCRRPYWLMGGWGLHILVDVFSHTDRFFPTPVFFPLSNFHISFVSWAEPVFMAVNYGALVTVYLWLYYFKRRKQQSVALAQ
jgi:hypothetical protein